MSLSVSLLHRRARLGVIAALVGLSGVCAHAEGGPAASASAASSAVAAPVVPALAAPSAAMAPASNAAVYVGRFESGCVNMIEHKLSFVDVFKVKALDAKTLSVDMDKVFYSSDECAADTVIGEVVVPKGKWTLDGQGKAGERTVDLVTVVLPAGEIKVAGRPGPKGKGSIVSQGDSIHVHYGNKETFSVSKLSEAGSDKDVRWLDKGKLFFGSPEKVGLDGYPVAINEEIFFTRR